MGVDEAGQERRVAEVDHRRAPRGHRQPRPHGLDLAPLDDHHPVAPRAIAAAVEQPRGLEDGDGGRRGGRRLLGSGRGGEGEQAEDGRQGDADLHREASMESANWDTATAPSCSQWARSVRMR